jgi:UDP-glucose 4-epimerase
MRAFVTGGAGFIGSTLTDRLLADGHSVVVFDNLSTGRERFLDEAARRPGFTFVRGDTLDGDGLAAAMAGSDVVFHLAANADVRFGTHHPRKDLEQNTIATFNVLEAMRAHGVPRVVFASTGSIYGEASVIPTPEDAPFPVQTSLYGASKLAGEGLIQGVRLPGVDLPVRVHTRRAIHARSRIRLLQEPAGRSDAITRAR